MIVLIVSVWLACGVAAAGMTYAYFQRKYAVVADMFRRSDVVLSVFIGCLGPVGLCVVLTQRTAAHGWLLPGRKP